MPDITLEQLQAFSDRSSTMVTVDAPLFGVIYIMNGRVLVRGGHGAEKGDSGSLGFPPHHEIIAEASRFWIQRDSGIRERKTREEMTRLLRESLRAVAST